jgi:hypothetical protein
MLMDWTKQAEDMLKSWTNSQQAMWDGWLKTLQGVGSDQAAQTWESSINTWQDSVKKALDAQNTWTQFWVESVTSGPGATQQATEWSKQLTDMTKRWVDTQTQLWDNWFETIKKSDPASFSKSWNNEEVQKMVETWQEAAQKAMESQMEWARMWVQAQQSDKK